MKIHFTKWSKGTFHTPHFIIIRSKGIYSNDPGYTQVSFVVANLHWWVIIPNKKK